MATISAKEVMALRQKTGLSMMECKKALVASEGDIAAAEEALRIKMKGKMDSRSDRAAGEGRVAISIDGTKGSIVELRAETDFTAKNETFGEAAQKVAQLSVSMDNGDVEPTDEMTKLMDEVRISTGENASIARAKVLGGDGSVFGQYVHHDGKTAVLVQFTGDVSDDVRRDVCMHITAAVPRPQGVTRDDVPDSVIEKERDLALKMAMEQGKPEDIAKKMVEGKVQKLYKELALLEQPFVKDPDKKIQDLLPEGSTVVAFERWGVGETGVEGTVDD